MYEYGPPSGKNPLDDEPGAKKHVYVPLKDQLAGLSSAATASKPAGSEERTDSKSLYEYSEESPTEDLYKPLNEVREYVPYVPEPVVRRAAEVKFDEPKTGVMQQAVSPSMSLLVAGLILVFMTVAISYFDEGERITILLWIGVIFLIASLVSLLGSHIMLKKNKGFAFFRAFNGVTVGAGIGFVISVIMLFLQIALI